MVEKLFLSVPQGYIHFKLQFRSHSLSIAAFIVIWLIVN